MVAAACLSHGLFSLVKSSLFGQFLQCWYHQRISTYFQRQTKGHLLLTEKATVQVLHLGRHLHVYMSPCNKASRSKYIMRIIQIKCMHLIKFIYYFADIVRFSREIEIVSVKTSG